jgi:hypothetical protein
VFIDTMSWRKLIDRVGDTEAVASTLEQRASRRSLGRKAFQVRIAFIGERPRAMALKDGWIREERLEHGVHLRVEGTTIAELCCEVAAEYPVIPGPCCDATTSRTSAHKPSNVVTNI